MLKGSATALVLVVLALVAIIIGGYVAITGAASTTYMYVVQNKGTVAGIVTMPGGDVYFASGHVEYLLMVPGSTITLTAKSSSGSYFDRWVGCTPANSATCTSTITTNPQYINVFFTSTAPPAVCSGTPSLTVSPASILVGETATLKVTAPSTACAGRATYFVGGYMTPPSCTIGIDGTCSISAKPTITGIHYYSVQVDTNGDGSFTGENRSAQATLNVSRVSLSGPGGPCNIDSDCQAGLTCVIATCRDTTPPTVSILMPKNGETVSGSVFISANASDNVGVTQLECKIDGIQRYIGAPISMLWNTTEETAGTHTIKVIAYDAAGNNNSDNITVTVAGADTTPPNVTVSISPELPKEGDVVTFTATASDNECLWGLDIYVDKGWPDYTAGGGRIASCGIIASGVQKTGTCSNDTATLGLTLTPGIHKYAAIVTDCNAAKTGTGNANSDPPPFKWTSGPTYWKYFNVTPVEKVALVIEPDSQAGERGDALEYKAKITNYRGNETTFVFNIACPSGWTCSPNSTIDVKNSATGLVPFSITSPANISLGSTTINTIAYDELNHEYNSSAQFTHIVKICSRVAPAITASETNIKGPGGLMKSISFDVANNDDCTGYFNYTIDCPADWNCTLTKTNNIVSVGGKDTISLNIIPAGDADIGSNSLNFTAINVKNINFANKSATINYTVIQCTDADSDGYYAESGDCGPVDCNDADPTIHPHAQEFCMDNADRNCNGIIGSQEQGCDRNQSALDQLIGKSPTPVGSKESTITPECGNDIVETDEDCDGNNDAQCHSLCVSCKCPFIIGDDVCDSAAGESAAISSDCKKKVGTTSILLIVIGILGALGGTYYFMRRRGKLGGLAAAHGVETAMPGGDLGTAVNSMLSEGYNPDEIHSSLESGGWSHSKVDSAFESAQADQEALGKLAEQQGVATPTAKAQATRYVKKCLEQGYEPTQIRTALMSSGWPAGTVDGAISKQTAKHIQAHAEKAGVGEPSTAHKEDLASYVKKELSEGHTKQSIKKVLKDAGWSSSDVSKAFKE